MKVKLESVRLAFPDLFQAKAINDGEPRFGACFIIEPGSKNAKALDSAISEVAKEKWKDKAGKLLPELGKKDKLCFRKEPKTNASGDIYDGFEGMCWLQAANKARPLILDRGKAPLTEQDGKPYAGCYVNVVLDIWAQDNKYGARVNATLTGVQFDKDGDAFSGGTPASVDDFEELGAGTADEFI